jgi:enterochelin esterase family protein
MRGRVVFETVGSPALRGNPLGDPRRREVPVYLPEAYFQGRSRRFPVLYYLPGFSSTSRSAVEAHPWKESVAGRLDRLIAQGRVRPMILVVPDCFTLYGGSQYMDSEGTGLYETHIVSELVPYIDSRYRTAGRGVVGKSSGGFGALRLAMRRPDVFPRAACHSGDMLFEVCGLLEVPKCVRALDEWGGSFPRFLRAFREAPVKDAFAHELVMMAAMCACYSPNPASPLGFDLPFDERTGEVRREVLARWKVHDPVEAAGDCAGNLRKLKLLYLDCGVKDEYFLQLGSRAFVRRLRALGVPHRYEEHPGGHFDTGPRLDVSFRLLGRSFHAA